MTPSASEVSISSGRLNFPLSPAIGSSCLAEYPKVCFQRNALARAFRRRFRARSDGERVFSSDPLPICGECARARVHACAHARVRARTRARARGAPLSRARFRAAAQPWIESDRARPGARVKSGQGARVIASRARRRRRARGCDPSRARAYERASARACVSACLRACGSGPIARAPSRAR